MKKMSVIDRHYWMQMMLVLVAIAGLLFYVRPARAEQGEMYTYPIPPSAGASQEKSMTLCWGTCISTWNDTDGSVLFVFPVYKSCTGIATNTPVIFNRMMDGNAVRFYLAKPLGSASCNNTTYANNGDVVEVKEDMTVRFKVGSDQFELSEESEALTFPRVIASDAGAILTSGFTMSGGSGYAQLGGGYLVLDQALNAMPGAAIGNLGGTVVGIIAGVDSTGRRTVGLGMPALWNELSAAGISAKGNRPGDPEPQ